MAGESVDRVKCPSCAELIAPEARLCLHCRQSTLVDVVLEGPVADGRLRYQLARQIASLGAPYPAFLEAQNRLAGPRPIVAQQLTVLDARRALEVLDRQSLPARTVSSGAPAPMPARPPSAGPSWPMVRLIAAGLLLALSGGLTVGVMLRHGRTAAGRGGAASESAARALSTEEIASAVLPSTVAVHCGRQLGAGFFVTENAVLTNAHVLGNGCQPISIILSDGRTGSGQRAHVSESVDLALIQVSDVTATPLVLGDAAETKPGEKVLLVGSPKGFEFSVQEGLVSSVSRSGFGTAYLQLDAKINPGNSGGPAVNMRGQVVGIVTLKRADAEGIGFALPINYAFAGAEPLVTAPPNIDPARFNTMLARASEQEQEQTAEVESALNAYALLKGGVEVETTQYGTGRKLALYVGRMSATPLLMIETHRMHVWLGSTRVCTVAMDVGDWEAVEGVDLKSLVDQRTAQWLGRKNLNARLYLGKGTLPQPPCPELPNGTRTYTIELEGADPEHSRLTVR